MKRFLTVIGIAGILILVFGATAFAARTPQGVTPQAGATSVPAAPTSAPSSTQPSGAQQQGSSDCCAIPSGQAVRGMGMMGGRMGGGMTLAPALRSGASAGVGGGMLGGSAETVQGHMAIAGDDMISRMAGVTPMHDDVEKMLGMNHQDLYDQMAAGKSLVQIAASRGVTETELINGIMAGRTEALDQAVAAGRMTRDQAETVLGYMQNNIQTMVNTPGMGLGTGGWGMMWNTQPSQPGQSGQQNQFGQTGGTTNSGGTFLGLRFGPWGMHR